MEECKKEKKNEQTPKCKILKIGGILLLLFLVISLLRPDLSMVGHAGLKFPMWGSIKRIGKKNLPLFIMIKEEVENPISFLGIIQVFLPIPM